MDQYIPYHDLLVILVEQTWDSAFNASLANKYAARILTWARKYAFLGPGWRQLKKAGRGKEPLWVDLGGRTLILRWDSCNIWLINIKYNQFDLRGVFLLV